LLEKSLLVSELLAKFIKLLKVYDVKVEFIKKWSWSVHCWSKRFLTKKRRWRSSSFYREFIGFDGATGAGCGPPLKFISENMSAIGLFSIGAGNFPSF
jgi:hypothetical protein